MGALENDSLLQSSELGETLKRLKTMTNEKEGVIYPFIAGEELQKDVKTLMSNGIPWASILSYGVVASLIFRLYKLVEKVYRQ